MQGLQLVMQILNNPVYLQLQDAYNIRNIERNP